MDFDTAEHISTLNIFVPLSKKLTYIDIISIQFELGRKYDAIAIITFYKLIKSDNAKVSDF